MLEFILVAPIILLISANTIAVGVFGYYRNLTIDSLVEATRFGTLADQSAQAGIEKARELLIGHFGSETPVFLSASENQASGGRQLVISAEVQIAGWGILGEIATLRAQVSSPFELPRAS